MICECGFKMKPKKAITIITKEDINIGMYCQTYTCKKCTKSTISKRERNRMTKVFDREYENIKAGKYAKE
jgi:hypothetical protein